MLQLVMANERSPLGFGHSGHAVGRPVGQAIVPAGGLSRPPETLNRPLRTLTRIFSGFVFRRHRAAKSEKFVSIQGGGLESPPAARIGCPLKGQSPVASERSPHALLETNGQAEACPTKTPMLN
jgi:hypothetical protein